MSEQWKFLLGLEHPPRSLQLVAKISADPHDTKSSHVYLYLAILCTPLTTKLLNESEALREWCNDKDVDHKVDHDTEEAFTRSADGTFRRVKCSGSCVIWNHVSIDTFTAPTDKARVAALAIGGKLAKILGASCGSEKTVTLLFAIREGKWISEQPGSLGYAVALGALAHLVKACQSTVLLSQLRYGLSDFKYYHRDPHISVLDLVAAQMLGTLSFYTYRDDDHKHDAMTDTNLVTVFFRPQAEVVRYYVDSSFWKTLDLDHFLHYTSGTGSKHALDSAFVR